MNIRDGSGEVSKESYIHKVQTEGRKETEIDIIPICVWGQVHFAYIRSCAISAHSSAFSWLRMSFIHP